MSCCCFDSSFECDKNECQVQGRHSSRWRNDGKLNLVALALVLSLTLCVPQCHCQIQVNLSPVSNYLQIYANPDLTIEIKLSEVPSDTGYVLVQAHAHLINVTISGDESFTAGVFTTGYNVGVVISPPDSAAYLKHGHKNVSVPVLLIAQFYDTNAPIPGGCNMELSIKTAPFLPTSFDENMLIVEYPLGSWPLNVKPATCDRAPLQYDVYELYFEERDFSTSTAFDSIRLMSNLTSIERNGKKVEFSGRPPSKVKFANYQAGRVVAVILRTLTASAAYTPTMSYGCLPNSANDEENCDVLASVGAKLLNAVLLFVGLFLLLVGHRFYKCQLFLLGFCMSAVLFYVILERVVAVGSTVAGTGATTVGALGGALWLALWSKLGSPMAPVLLAALLLGSLLASVVAYTPLADIAVLKDDLPFWLSFGCFTLAVPLLLISFAQLTSIVVTSVLGSYMVIIPIDSYIGANLKYIVLNVFRRATTPDFETAIVDPPFQTKDLVLVIVWAALAVVGIVIQWWRERGRPPFPPPPPSALSSLRYEAVTAPPSYSSTTTASAPFYYPQMGRDRQDEPGSRHSEDSQKKMSSGSVIVGEATETTPLLTKS